MTKEQEIKESAELYNLWFTGLHDYRENPNMEPYSNTLKEDVGMNNKSLEGVDNIGDTDYVINVVYQYHW